ncbi:MAG: SNF2-related protein [Bradymonadia bacterium]
MDPHDPFLCDAADLRALASDVIVERGIDYQRQGRVKHFERAGDQLVAEVQGSDEAPYTLTLRAAVDGGLSLECSCPFDWEPVCKHGIAALLAYTERHLVGDHELKKAEARALYDRKRRGAHEVEVEHISGEPTFGTWHAKTEKSKRTWTVQIRSGSERVNLCDCPDFAMNRLGTCKHIEAVLHALGPTARKGWGDSRQANATAIVYLAWDVDAAPRIRVKRPARDLLLADLHGMVDAHFDAEGFLKLAPPDGFEAFVSAAEEAMAGDTPSVIVGEDAWGYVRRQREAVTRAATQRQTRQQILDAEGHIEGLDAKLYPYQVEGVAFLAAQGRALLADDMGLGKTVQSIAATLHLRAHQGVQRTLVVCPASLKHQWAREIERFTDLETTVIEGGARARKALYRRQSPFTLVNYEVVLRDLDTVASLLSPDLLILDEAQRIKNWRTRTAQAIKSIESRFAFVLTGTPLENRLEDLYSLMQVVNPHVLGPLWRFMVEYHITDDRDRLLGYRNLSHLRQRLGGAMLRRDRRTVRDQLPDRIEQRLDLPMTAIQRKLHDEAVQSATQLAAMSQHRPLTPSESRGLMKALQMARMASNAAGLVDGVTEGSPKLDELGRLLESLCVDNQNKVVIFSEWTRMTEMAQAVVEKLGLESVRLHGGVPTAKRGALIDRFHNDPEVKVFISTDAGGVGLNLQEASALINLDLPWNPARLEQRIARVHRLGQDVSVQIIKLVSAGSYEERVARLIADKRQLFDSVVNEDATADVVALSQRMLDVVVELFVDPEDRILRKGGVTTHPQLPLSGRAPSGAEIDATDPPRPSTPPQGELPLSEGAPSTPTSPEEKASTAALAGPARETRIERPSLSAAAQVEALVEMARVAFDERLSAVLSSTEHGAPAGVIFVVDALDAWARKLSHAITRDPVITLPVALIDTEAHDALSQFPDGGPLSNTRRVWGRIEA